MEKIQNGKYVEIVYDLFRINPDGSETLVHQSDPESPENFVFGVTPGLVSTLAAAIDGKEAGAEFNITAGSEEAFGQRSDEYIIKLEKEIFYVDGKFDNSIVKPGESLPMTTADGFQVYGIVVEVGKDTVTMDFNHPLAGFPVRYKGTVKTVRDASQEELKASQGCGCGSCGGSCQEGDCGCSGEGGCGNCQ